MNSLWDIRIFLGLVPKESPCINEVCETNKKFLDVRTIGTLTNTNTNIKMLVVLHCQQVYRPTAILW
jgi:hypothetical protein